MDKSVRELVRNRARGYCEYCGLSRDTAPFAQFHVEHIIARQHGGTDDSDNLALACFHCNVNKGPNLSSVDPDTRQIVPLFDPRRQTWAEHFAPARSTDRGTDALGARDGEPLADE